MILWLWLCRESATMIFGIVQATSVPGAIKYLEQKSFRAAGLGEGVSSPRVGCAQACPAQASVS